MTLDQKYELLKKREALRDIGIVTSRYVHGVIGGDLSVLVNKIQEQ